MDENTLASIGLSIVCGYLAYLLMRWLWPILEQRKDLTPLQMLDRAIAAPGEEQHRQAFKYGSLKMTLVVHLVNVSLLFAWVNFGVKSEVILWGVFIYQCAGFLVLRWIRLPGVADLAGLNGNERLWLRVFYAWLWPVYLLYLWRRK